MTNDNMQDRLERFDVRGEITLDDLARKVLRGYADLDEHMEYHQSADAQIHLPVPQEGKAWLAA